MTAPPRMASPPPGAFPHARRLAHGMAETAAALQEVLALPDTAWGPHFNLAKHNGGWHVAALRSTPRSPLSAAPGEFAADLFQDESAMAQCPAVQALVAGIAGGAPLKSVRVLRLVPGRTILEHTDAGVGLRDGEVRLHLPLQTHGEVFFYVDGQRVPMRTGEWWYGDFSLPHRVANRGTTERLHLVLDCEATPALRAAIAAGDAGRPYPHAEDPQWRFAQFREQVFGDPALQDRLLGIYSREDFAAACIALGGDRGWAFTEAEVLSAMASGRQAWMQQWVV
ncbi:aspartyl/asparaginyl beta-hydroxylase domain-containing protein [Acidovorax sp. GBBC 3334]|uniref:aspartyl/asparaginyl beta-hydroxylase domain-containing protein n=1 Tax=Acidovorax sp. GBBC 3334 TaxID=2940496 RepID=UPI002303A7F5|nr:aspartyl/asparaginyl beta-hydroxylase domain-containing protein [Acidovorax sp. GBBC 3334]MDA8454761.1 aspartyl/asparaginyl beta-hydroxylase domain-containing protein [Acidovorax sp. GBBC 3334]